MIKEEATATLTVDDLLGIWNLVYTSGQTGTFTISKKDDGRPKIEVWTTQGGESEAEDIVIEHDTVTFARKINIRESSLRASYALKLVNGEFEGTTKFGWQNAGIPFTASRAE